MSYFVLYKQCAASTGRLRSRYSLWTPHGQEPRPAALRHARAELPARMLFFKTPLLYRSWLL